MSVFDRRKARCEGGCFPFAYRKQLVQLLTLTCLERAKMRIWMCLLTLVLGACAALSAEAHSKPASLAFDHVNVVDVVNGQVLPDRTVIVDQGRIVSVQRSSPTPPNALQLVDGRGAYLIPGLWDMHVHLFRHSPRGQNDRTWFPLFVANGVTGVRDMFGNLDDLPIMARWRRELAAGRVGPRIVAAGALIDGEPPHWEGSLTARNADEARKLVRAAKRGGADFIKPYDGLSPALFAALADEARRSNMGFAGHVPFSVRAADAAATGLQSLEHMGLLDRDCSSSDRSLDAWREMLDRRDGSFNRAIISEYDSTRCEAIAERLARSRAWVEIDFVSRMAMADQRWRSRDLLRYIKPSLRADWPAERPPAVEQRLAAKERVKTQVARVLLQGGVRLFAGTDVGNPYLVPGFSLHDTLELMVSEAGFTPAQALRTATNNPARFMKLDNIQGSVAEGREADLVLLSANPLLAIRNTRAIVAVVARGKFFNRAQLDALLVEAEAAARE